LACVLSASALLSHSFFPFLRLLLFLVSTLFFFQCSRAHPDLHSFPTRRSSDLFHGRNTACLVGGLRDDLGRTCKFGGSRAQRDKDRKSTRLNFSHEWISYAVFCLKKKRKAEKTKENMHTRLAMQHIHACTGMQT